ncbi:MULTISPECIES: ATP-binding protein [Clostridium]|uniref:DnaA/Hda family protein n=1 Tax=Clostridium lapidicellarium TaxID=3240931 RepID=A0ABV4DXS7_9CLOT
MKQIIQDLKREQPKMRENDSSKEQKKLPGDIWKILNATSDCPYHMCDGSGIIFMQNRETLETKAKYCKCKEQLIYSQRLQFANIPSEFSSLTVNSFDTQIYKTQADRETAKTAKIMTANYIKSFEKFREKAKGLYYYSSTRGSGKTRLAVSLGNALLKVRHMQVKFITTLDLLKEIRNTYNKNTQYTESQLIESINSVQVLIVDDIGVEQPTNWVNEMLFSIFDTRMKYNKITIFTSNCSIENLQHDERLKSRIFKMAIPVKMPEEDVRKGQSKRDNEELQNILLRGE